MACCLSLEDNPRCYNSVCSDIDKLLFFHGLYLLSNSEDLSKTIFPVIAYLFLEIFSLISLQFGSHQTLGGDVPRGKPTYVFPETLKNVVREIIPGALVDRPDPTHVNVSFFFLLNFIENINKNISLNISVLPPYFFYMFHSHTNIQNNITPISPTRSKGFKFTDIPASHTKWLFSVFAGVQGQHWRPCCGKVASSQEEKEPLNKIYINIFLCLYV